MDKVPCNSSWTCRKILKLRDAARPYIQHKIEGDCLFLCHDSWQSGWASISKIGQRLIYEAASSFDAKISSDIKDGQWRWKPDRSEDLMLVQSKLFQVENKNRDSVIGSCLNLVNSIVLWHGRIFKQSSPPIL
jgi:hypothetical protein